MLKKLFSYAGDYRKNGYLAVLYILLSVISEISTFYIVYLLINIIIEGELTLNIILYYGVAIIILYGLKSTLFSLGLDNSHIFAYNTLFNIRKKFAMKIKKISLGTILTKGAGGYRQNFVDDIENIELLLAHGLPEGLPYFISCITVYIALFIVDFRIGLLSLITIPIGIIAMGGMVKSGTEKQEQYHKSLVNLNNSIIEYVKGMEVVKIFNKTKISNKKINDAIVSYRDFTVGWYKNNWNYMAVFQSVVPSTVAFILPCGLYMVYNGTLELSVLLFCIILALSISTPLLKLMNYFPVLHNVINKIEKLEQQFDQPEIKVGNSDNMVKSNDIEFNDVTFSYDNTQVIKNMNFKIKENSKIGIVGESGSGKSTIGKLMMHYWDIDSGQILFGGVDIRDISLKELMSRVSYVSQDNFLFNMSIKDNLLIAKPDATDEEIIKACKYAQCYDLIMSLDDGFNTNVGDCGSKLSGGERQRITIARAILKDSSVIILDEATSYTDPENNVLIDKAIMHLTENKTLITIAHKLKTMKDMDNIILVDEGKLVDFAPHEKLLNNDIYKNLWNRHVRSLEYKFNVKEYYYG
jgi:ABC-type multidrug transport system fused ATPase/permease subunit